MTRKKRLRSVGVVAAVLAAAGAAWTNAAAQANAAPQANARPIVSPAPDSPGRTVTLVTGDKVTVLNTAGPSISVQPGPGRAGTRFMTQAVGGHLRVIPADAMQALHDNRLDPRLFDVVELSQSLLAKVDLPVIMSYPDAGARSAGRASIGKTGAKPGRDLPALRGFSAKVAAADLGAFWKAVKSGGTGKAKVWLDGVRKPTLDVSVPMIGGSAARAAGLDGAGVKVAVVDTGVDATHPDLSGRVIGEQNFTEGVEDNADHVGHGTHVASAIAGTGAASGGRYAGVAPGASLLDAKVCVVDGCADSWILAGMQWAADQGAQIVNLSLGSNDSPGLDPIEQAVQNLTASNGVLFVVASGNDGPGPSTVGAPGTVEAALTVGAVDKSDHLADFSSRGPVLDTGVIKPDITGPGVEITAARSKEAEQGSGSYLTLSGTSMATPHVAGAAAAVKQQHPQWTPAQLRSALMASAKLNTGQSVFDQGAGRVELAKAITQQVFATPPSVGFGLQQWPHDDDQAKTSTVTYNNEGNAAVTLHLALNSSAPAGMFTLSATSVTVPAGGKADVKLTADTRVGTADGTFSGYLTATTDGIEVRAPFAVQREAESYDLTLVHTGRDGKPATRFSTVIIGLDNNVLQVVGEDSTTLVRLPKGRYTVDSTIFDDISGTQLVQPVVDLSSARTVNLDARLGQPVRITIPDPAALPLTAELTTRDKGHDGSTYIGGVFGDSFDGLYSARIGPDSTTPGPVTTVVGGRWAHPGPGGSPVDSKEVYGLYWFTAGHMNSGFDKTVTKASLAEVHQTFGNTAPGVGGSSSMDASDGSGQANLLGYSLEMPLPFERISYVNPESLWSGGFFEDVRTGFEYLQSTSTRYAAGRRVDEQWNRAVFGPSAGAMIRNPAGRMYVNAALFGDGLGHDGRSATADPTVTLTRDRVVVPGEATEGGYSYPVPDASGTYKLTATADRGAPAVLSTHVEAAWTFKSAAVQTRTPLPTSVVRFTPRVDAFSTAPKGVAYPVRVSVDPTPGSTATAAATLAVQVSYDDGTTWQNAVLRNGSVLLKHPDVAGFVSLRAQSTDTNGNKVEQTVIRAYKIA